MNLIFKVQTYNEPIDLSAPISDLDNWPRVAGLSWVIVNDEGKLVRGFTFKLLHDVGKLDFPEAVGVDLTNNGIPATRVISKFLSDYDSCRTLIAHNLKRDYSILAAEAVRYRLQAKTRIETRICTQTDIEEIYGREGRALSDLYYSLFEAEIDDDLGFQTEVTVLVDIVKELIERGILKPTPVLQT